MRVSLDIQFHHTGVCTLIHGERERERGTEREGERERDRDRASTSYRELCAATVCLCRDETRCKSLHVVLDRNMHELVHVAFACFCQRYVRHI